MSFGSGAYLKVLAARTAATGPDERRGLEIVILTSQIEDKQRKQVSIAALETEIKEIGKRKYTKF